MTKNSKISKIVFWTLVLFSIIIMVVNRDLFSNPNVYNYSLSTIAQGFIALVAFLGAVVVFKLQLFENELNRLVDTARPAVCYFKGLVASNTLSPTEILDLVDSQKKSLDDSPEVPF